MLKSICAAALSFLASISSAGEPDRSKLFESSTGFDQESVGPFLLRVVGLVESGFSDADATRLTALIGKLKVEESRTWSFSVSFQGAPTPLVVEAFQDDVEATDLYFYTSAELADRIDSEIETFSDELGQ